MILKLQKERFRKSDYIVILSCLRQFLRMISVKQDGSPLKKTELLLEKLKYQWYLKHF